MPGTRRAKTRLPLQQRGWAVVIGLLMLLALLGPHTPWSVCMTGRCVPATASPTVAEVVSAPVAEIGTATGGEIASAAATSCCCCGATNAPASRPRAPAPDGPEPKNGADSCHGCCIDLATEIDEGPLPQPVITPDVQTGTAAILPPPPPTVSSAKAARWSGYDTGPPRAAALLDQLRTTVLRE